MGGKKGPKTKKKSKRQKQTAGVDKELEEWCAASLAAQHVMLTSPGMAGQASMDGGSSGAVAPVASVRANQTPPRGSPVELHCHSHCSDGLLSPSALVQRAAERGVRVLALTDHDTFHGVLEAAAAGLRVGIAILPGVEISAFLDDSDKVRAPAPPAAPVCSSNALPPSLTDSPPSSVSLSPAARGHVSVHVLGYFTPPTSAILAAAGPGAVNPSVAAAVAVAAAAQPPATATVAASTAAASGAPAVSAPALDAASSAAPHSCHGSDGTSNQNCCDLVRCLQRIRQGRLSRLEHIVNSLSLSLRSTTRDGCGAAGQLVTVDDVLREAGPSVSPGRMHIARVLVAKGYVATTRDAFTCYLGDNSAAVAAAAAVAAVEPRSIETNRRAELAMDDGDDDEDDADDEDDMSDNDDKEEFSSSSSGKIAANSSDVPPSRQCHDEDEARAQFDSLLSDAKGDAAAEVPMAVAVECIRRAGGVAVLAHPWTVRGWDPTVLLRRAKRDGVEGVEVWRGQTRVRDYDQAARRLGLLRLGGSDYHARNEKGETDVGGSPAQLSEFVRLVKLLHEKHTAGLTALSKDKAEDVQTVTT